MLIPFIRLAAASALFLSTRAAGPRESLLVNAQWLADHLHDPKLVLLHIGDRATYDAGHIPRARFMTLADISLYAYTHVAHDGGFDLSGYPAIGSWLDRVAAEPGHVSIEA